MEGQWIECRYGGRVCYMQVADVGPWKTDSFAYVFQGAPPDRNPNRNAGI
jgi:hypothetical protein